MRENRSMALVINIVKLFLLEAKTELANIHINYVVGCKQLTDKVKICMKKGWIETVKW